MKFYKVSCILYIMTGILSKLILSNTVEPISHLDILNDQIDLRIWMQIRKPFFSKMDEQKLAAFRIVDQNNQDQLLIQIHTPDQKKITIDYEFQNSIRSNQSIYINQNEHSYEWIWINSYRNICFYRLYNDKINMSINCDQQFNATLFTIRQSQFLILIYDKIEFSNQEILISDFPLIQNHFTFNILLNDLQILFYAKYYCKLDQEGVFYNQKIGYISSLNLIFKRDFVHVEFLMLNQIQNQTKIQQNLQYDQWLFCLIQFNSYEVSIYLQINDERFDLTQDVGLYFGNQYKQLLNYSFLNDILIQNSQTLKWGKLLIINNIEQKSNLINYNLLCVRDCQNCGEFTCQDYQNKKNLSFTISQDIQLSNYYLNIFPNYQEYFCTDIKFQLKDNICVEWPKYYGEYCINCQYLQKKLNMNQEIIDLILDLNYNYYLNKFNQITEDDKQIPFFLILVQDLNIFLLKIKDIFLIYKRKINFIVKKIIFIKIKNVQRT